MVKQGSLTMLVGCMFAGKTTALLLKGAIHEQEGHSIVYLKPKFDNRYSSDEIVTHDGLNVKAHAIAKGDDDVLAVDGINEADVVLVDEVQFFHEEFIQDIVKLVRLGKTVYCAGLDTDYLQEPFPVTAYLLAIADQVEKIKAICADCGGEASNSTRTEQIEGKVVIGSNDIYKPTCNVCSYKYL